MSTNQISDRGDSLTLPVPSGTASGKPVLVGALKGFTRTPEGEGVGNADGFATVDLVGCYETLVTGALKVGTPIYMVGTADGNGLLAGTLTATSTDNTLFGTSLTVKGSGSGLATVRPVRV